MSIFHFINNIFLQKIIIILYIYYYYLIIDIKNAKIIITNYQFFKIDKERIRKKIVS